MNAAWMSRNHVQLRKVKRLCIVRYAEAVYRPDLRKDRALPNSPRVELYPRTNRRNYSSVVYFGRGGIRVNFIRN